MTGAAADSAVQRLLDVHEIANLQGRYMYFIQSHCYEEILALFAADDPAVSVEIAESGIYEGIDKIRTLFVDMFKPLFMAPGSLPIHLLTTPVIEIGADGQTARGMWQTLGCNSFPSKDGLVATWQQGKYDNSFIREHGQWRFKQFRWLCNFRTPHNKGWVEQPMVRVDPLNYENFPDAMRPTRMGERHDAYDPAAVMAFGPLPPQPEKQGD